MERQSLQKVSCDFVRQVPKANQCFFLFFYAVRSHWVSATSRVGKEVRLMETCARACTNKQGGDYFSTHDSANSEWIKSDPAHSADKPNPCRSQPLAFVFLTNAVPAPSPGLFNRFKICVVSAHHSGMKMSKQIIWMSQLTNPMCVFRLDLCVGPRSILTVARWLFAYTQTCIKRGRHTYIRCSFFPEDGAFFFFHNSARILM